MGIFWNWLAFWDLGNVLLSAINTPSLRPNWKIAMFLFLMKYSQLANFSVLTSDFCCCPWMINLDSTKHSLHDIATIAIDLYRVLVKGLYFITVCHFYRQTVLFLWETFG